MSRRRIDYTVEPDLFGFDAIGADYSVSAAERVALLGLGVLPIAVYFACLKPFTKGDGRVYALSYYRLSQILRHRREGAGRRLVDPTLDQLRKAIDMLESAALVRRSPVDNRAKGVLQIWVVHGVGGTATRLIDPGYSPSARTAASRAIA